MVNREDTYRHKGLRNQLVEELRAKGIGDERVLKAIKRVPRHIFFDAVFTEQAYSNMAFQIGAGQTISHPYTVAFQNVPFTTHKIHLLSRVRPIIPYFCL